MQMQTPYGSPDSLRQFLQLSKKFYQLHTRKNFGYEDCDGLQYSGSIQNMGAELLLEARKLRMRKPPIPIIRPSQFFAYYFNISYSDFIDTYRQPNMIMGCVKKDVMLSNHTYQLRFDDCELVNVNRAEAYSDHDVRISQFYQTTIPPTLIIDGSEEHPIFIKANQTEDNPSIPTWFFAKNSTTDGLYEITNVGFELQLTTVDLKPYVDLPFIWLCDPTMNMYPPFSWTEQPVLVKNMCKLEHGTDGNDIDHLYPLTYAAVPSGEHWYLKAHANFFPNKNDTRNLDVKIHRIEFIRSETGDFTKEPLEVEAFEYDDTYVKVSLGNCPWTFRVPQFGDYDYDGATYNNPMVACLDLNWFANNTPTMEHPDPILTAAFDISYNGKYYHKFETEVNQMRAGIHLDNTSMSMKHTVDKHNTIVDNLSRFEGLPSWYQDLAYRKSMGVNTHHTHIDLYAIRDDANDPNLNTIRHKYVDATHTQQTAGIIIDAGIPVNSEKSVSPGTKSVVYYDLTKTLTYSTNENNITSELNYVTDVVYVDDNKFADRSMSKYEDYKRFVYHGNGRFSLGMISMDSTTNYGRCYLLSNDKEDYENNATSKNPKAPATAARVCDIPTSFTQLQNIEGISPTLVIDPNYIRQYAPFTPSEYLKLWNSFKSGWIKNSEISPRLKHHYIFNDMYTLERTDPLHQNGDVVYDRNKVYVNLSQTTITITYPGRGYDVGNQFGFNIGGVFIRGTVNSTVGYGGIETFTLELNTSIPDQTGELSAVSIPLSNFDNYITTYQLSTLSGSGVGATLTIRINDSIWNTYQATKIDDQDDTLHDMYYELLQTQPANWNFLYTSYYIQTGEYPNYQYEHVPESAEPPTFQQYMYFEKKQAYKRTNYPILDGSIYAFIHYPNLDGISVIGFDRTSDTEGFWDRSSVTQLSGDLEVGDVYYDDTRTKAQRTVLNTYLYNTLTNQNFEPDDILGHINGDKTITLHTKSMSFDPSEGITIETITSNEDFHQLVNDCGMNVWNAFISLVPTVDLTKFYAITWSYDMNASHLYQGKNQNLLFPAKSNGIHVNDYDNSWSAIKFNKRNGRMIPFMYDVLHTTFDSYVENGSVLKLTNQKKIKLSDMLPLNTEEYPTDAQLAHNGSAMNFNLYRYNHLYLDALKRYENELYQYSNDELYNMAIEMFGEDDSMLTRYYSYRTDEYHSNTLYQIGSLIIDRMITVYYAMQHVYGLDDMIVEPSSNELYRATRPFVSATSDTLRHALERDVQLGNLVYVSMNPEHPQDKMYRALRTFTSTSIPEDLENENMVYVGFCSKASDIINYILQNQPTYNPLKFAGDDRLTIEKDHLMEIDSDNPIGGYVPLVETVDDMNTANDNKVNADPLYIFRLDGFNISQLDRFRMYDGDVDISAQTMLIIKVDQQYRQYVFHNDKWEWNYHS